MISSIIEASLKVFSTDLVTDIFLIALVFLLVVSCYRVYKNTHNEFTHNAPNLLTSLGILGTFTGIVIGLLDFNVKDIDGSIDLLLNGLKIAFITSLAGILFSIILKIYIVTKKQKKEIIKDDVTMSDLYSIMNTQNENLIKLQKTLSNDDDSSLIGQMKQIRLDMSDNHKSSNKTVEQFIEPISKLNGINDILNQSNENLIKLQKTLSNDDDSSIVGQVKQLRLDMSDNHKSSNKTIEQFVEPITKINENLTNIDSRILNQQEFFSKFSDVLWLKLQDFADMLSKSATEQVIEALNNVMKDFNNKLSEQFGENFKQLNNAVGNLLVWQDNYKEQLGDMKNQFENSVGSIGLMEKSIESISTHSKSIPESMNHLEDIIITNKVQVQELHRHLEAFKDIRDRAVQAVPEIRNQIDATINGITKASEELIGGVSSSTEKITNSISKSADEFIENTNTTNNALVQSSNIISKSTTDIKDELENALSDINQQTKEMVENLSKNSKDVSKDFKEMGETLASEITKNNTTVSNQIEESNSSLNETTKKIQENLQDLTKNLQKDLESLLTEQVKQTKQVFESLDNTIKQTTEKTGESISNQIKIIDEQAGNEIENVMNAMGKALTRISNQFTNDYQKLVTEMKKIVEMKE